MSCNHPLGFTELRNGQLVCHDCGTPCPGYCVCDAPYLSMLCMNRAHARGPRLAAKDDDDDCEGCGWPYEHPTPRTPRAVHPDDMPTTTGPERVAQAIARDRGGWAPREHVQFAREEQTR